MTPEVSVPSRKERADAYAFTRDRLISAFLHPADPDAAAPRRTWRASLGGTAVAGVAIGVMILLGLGNGTVPTTSGIYVDKAGARYVYRDGQLHPLLNTASADLLFGPRPELHDLAAGYTAEHTAGASIGIEGAPEQLPPSSSLDLHTWSLCTGDALEIGFPAPAMISPTQAVLVRAADIPYLLADGRRYRIADQAVVRYFNGLGEPGVVVDQRWLSVIPEGPPLVVPHVAEVGRPISATAHPDSMNRIGMFATLTTASGERQFFILTRNGLTQVNETTYELYQANPRLRTRLEADDREIHLMPEDIADLDISVGAVGSPLWPNRLPEVIHGVGADPSEAALCVDRPDATKLGFSLSPTPPVPPTQPTMMRPGHALIAQDETTGTKFLILGNGVRYPLSDDKNADAVHQLGYDNAPVDQVSSAWLALLPIGPPLDPHAAEMLHP